jgi:DASS family divalent anion:Na+ symporter
MNNKLVRALVTVAVGAAIWLAPAPAGVKPQAWQLFAIFVSTILGFILQPLPMGPIAIVSITLTALAGVLRPGEILSGFANGTIWLIVAALLFARGFIKSGLGRRIAYIFMSLFGGSTLSLGYSLVASDLIISMATPSNTARAGGILFPIARSLSSAFGSEPGDNPRRFGAYMMQAVYQGNVVTSAMFMTAMAGNPLIGELARKTLNINITWLNWASAAIVPGLTSLVVVPFFLYLIYPPEIKKTPEAKDIARQELADMGPMTAAEKVVAFAFVIALALWVAAGLTKTLPWMPVIDATVVALLAVSIMLVTRVLEWQDVLAEKGAWDTLIWMGTIVGLAGFLAKLGFISWFAKTVSAGITGIAWVPALGILLVVYMYAHYGFASLTAHITAMYAAFTAVAVAAGAPVMLAALAFGFLSNLCMSLTHYAAGPSPIFFNAGYIDQGTWWRLGFTISVVNLVIWVGLGSLWWKILGLW